jgi:hypothetical protein
VWQVFEDFRYVRELGAEGRGRPRASSSRRASGTAPAEGIDLLHTGPDGLVDELVVMIRPLSAANALAEAMRELLAPAEG